VVKQYKKWGKSNSVVALKKDKKILQTSQLMEGVINFIACWYLDLFVFCILPLNNEYHYPSYTKEARLGKCLSEIQNAAQMNVFEARD